MSSKAEMRAELERLMASYKGEIRPLEPAQKPSAPRKSKSAALAEIKRSIEAAEASMRVEAPPAEPKDATKDGSGVDLGGITRYKEADYDAARGPRDHARRAWRMPKDKRSRGYVEMMIAAYDDDDYYEYETERHLQSPAERESERRFRTAGKTGKHCGSCGRAFEPDDPVWRVRRKYDSDVVAYDSSFSWAKRYETEDVVAPVCLKCWERQQARVHLPLVEPCSGCGRTVHVTPKALKSWLAHGKRAYCCDDCSRRPVIKRSAFIRTCASCGKSFESRRLDARFCSKACNMRERRKNKSR
jgi:predicted nucleic acid-binding Zn ribbon protein